MPDKLQKDIDTALSERSRGAIDFAPGASATFIWSLSGLHFELDAPASDDSELEFPTRLDSVPGPPRDRAEQKREAYARAPEPPPWLLGFSSGFCNQTDKIDRKLQGQILEAVAELSSSELKAPLGDTLKPLHGDYKGCWRYRIGDFRLIFQPDRATATITLIAFLPRGGAHD